MTHEAGFRTRDLELVSLTLADKLVRAGETTSHAYFPLHSVIALVSSTDAGQSLEIAAVGREGIAGGVGAVVSGESAVDLVVQVPGTALKLAGNRLRTWIEESPPFRKRWLRYLHMLATQMTMTAACHRYHSAPRRLAKWLLAVADRAETDTIPLTHDFAATLVGGDRPRISLALSNLRERRLIDHRRGQVRILDRKGLMRASCACYERIRELGLTT